MPVSLVGIAWYRREDYDNLKATFKDSEDLPDTFDEWLEKAERVSGTLTGQGIAVVKAYIDPETFPAWCRDHGFEMDKVARMEFGTECAANKLSAQRGRQKRARALALARQLRRRRPRGTE